jgi:hypothetical protein
MTNQGPKIARAGFGTACFRYFRSSIPASPVYPVLKRPWKCSKMLLLTMPRSFNRRALAAGGGALVEKTVPQWGKMGTNNLKYNDFPVIRRKLI